MQGVILAAGRGTRMGNIEVPKCLLKIGNITLIDHQLSCLKKLGIDDVLVVTGFHHDMIRDHLGSGVEYIFNENFENGRLYYDDTNIPIGSEPFFIHSKNNGVILEIPEIRINKVINRSGKIALMTNRGCFSIWIGQ